MSDFSHGDIKQEHGRLKNIQTDNRFDQIFASDDDIETGHHQENNNPIIIKA